MSTDHSLARTLKDRIEQRLESFNHEFHAVNESLCPLCLAAWNLPPEPRPQRACAVHTQELIETVARLRQTINYLSPA